MIVDILTNPYVTQILIAIAIFGAVLQIVPGLVYFERKLSAWIQNRVGPNRVGPKGALQPLADVIKLAFKEDVTPEGSDRWIYTLAPVLVYAPAILAFAVVPVGMEIQAVNFPSLGIIFLLTVGSFGVYGLAFGGWASNNKYSLLGGLRSSAQMISYEVALGLAVISILMQSGTVDMQKIVADQYGLSGFAGLGGFLDWNLFQQPVAAVVFLIASFAETNRLPFDLPECEAELVGGYHTEYSSLKFAVFFLGEYVAMLTMSALMVTLFLGGWHLPWLDISEPTLATKLLSVLIFTGKTTVLLFFFIWVRWTFPRFRYDQLMHLGWKLLIPVALANLALTALSGVMGWNWLIPIPGGSVDAAGGH